MATTFTLDFNGTTAGNNTSPYDDSALTNPTITLFSGVTVDTSNNGTGDRPLSITLHISNPSTTMSFSLTSTAAAQAQSSGITFNFNSATGNITFTAATEQAASVWQTILRGLQYKNTADEPLNTSHTITLVSAQPGSGTYSTVTGVNQDIINVSCFYKNTRISTPAGEVAVETLKRGDLVVTSSGEIVPIQWLGRQTVSTVFADALHVMPIRIKAGALAENLPVRDLLVSPDHALLIDGILAQAGALVNGISIIRETDVPTIFVYYHVELADHSLILAEGVPAETFIDNVDRLGFDNWAEHEALYPEATPIVEMDLPRAKSYRQVPRVIHERLIARGTALFGASSQTAQAA